MKFFKRKSRQEIVSQFTDKLLHEILISDLSNSEIAIVLKGLSSIGKQTLEERKSSLEKQLLETCNAINSL